VPFLLLAACLLPSLVSAQWVDTTLYIPDSMTGLSYPDCLVRNLTNHTIYVGGESDNIVMALDDRTGQKLARIPIGAVTYSFCCDESANLIYCANYDDQVVTVINGADNRVISQYRVPAWPSLLFVNSETGHLLCADDGDGGFLVLDGPTGQVIKRLPLDGQCVTSFAMNPVHHKIYAETEEDFWVLDAVAETLSRCVALVCDSTSLAYNPVYDRLYCVCDTGIPGIAVIDGATDQILKVLTTPEHWQYLLTLNGTGSRVYSMDDCGYLTTVDCALDTILDVQDLTATPVGLWLDPSLNRLFCLDEDEGQVIDFDCASGHVRARIPVPWAYVGFAGNPQDHLVYCTDPDDDTIYVVNCTADSVQAHVVLPNSDLHDLCLNPGKNCIYVADYLSGDVSVIDAATSRITATVSTDHRVYGLACNPANNKVYCAQSGAGTVTVFSGQTNQVLARVPVGAGPRYLVCNSANNRVYCANYSGNSVTVIDSDSDQVLATIPVRKRPYAICCNPVQNKVYTANYNDSSVSVIDCAHNSVIARVRVGRNPVALVYDPTGNKVYCASEKRDTVYAISGATDSVVAVVHVGHTPAALAYSTGFDKVYCASRADNSVTVIDAETDRVLATVPVGTDPRHLFCDSVSGLVYCSNRGSDNVTVILSANEQVLRTIPVQDGPTCIAASAAGDRVYVINEYRSSISVLRDAGSVTPVSGIGGATLFGHDLTLLGTKPASIYDLNGRKRGELLPGANDLKRFPAGIYFVRLVSGGPRTAKVVIAR
jgi:YVTN family beta-propeller protein